MRKSKSDFPKKISVGGVSFKIKWQSPDEDPENNGSFNIDDKTIFLNESTLKDGSALQTLFHEMVHASLAVGGLAYSLPEGMEESVVRNMEYILFPSFLNLVGGK